MYQNGPYPMLYPAIIFVKIGVWYGRRSIGQRLEMTNNLTAFSFDKEVNMS